MVSYGLIKNINEKNIIHSCATDNGSSGGPIISLKNFKIIGIHYGFKTQFNSNIGTFMKSIVKELNDYKNSSNINENSINNSIS